MNATTAATEQKETDGQDRSTTDSSAPALQFGSAQPSVGLSTRRMELPLFLGVLVVLSGLAWAPVITAGSLDAGGGLYIAFGMWVPAVAALSTRALCHGTLRGLGWRLGKRRYLAYGYILPLMLAAAVYAIAWLTGVARFSPHGITNSLPVPRQLSDEVGASVLLWLAASGTVVVFLAGLTALGKEIGWRGFLVPILVSRLGFHRAALVTGGLWTVWHAPLLLFADYNAGTPFWYSFACFSVILISASVVYTWFRLRSGNIWPVVLLHASHNAFIQEFFDPLTAGAASGATPYVTTEFGLGLALAWLLAAMWFWRNSPERCD